MALAPYEHVIDRSELVVSSAELRSLLTELIVHVIDRLACGVVPLAVRYVRTAAAARYLTLDPATLADWRSEPGKGPAYRKVGGRVVYAVVDLGAWLERHPLQGGARQ
jgi:hypothetical protein